MDCELIGTQGGGYPSLLHQVVRLFGCFWGSLCPIWSICKHWEQPLITINHRWDCYGYFASVPWYRRPNTYMKKYMVASLPRVHLLGIYWYPLGLNFDPKGHHWVKSWNFSKLLNDTGIGICWWTLIVSSWGLVLIGHSFLGGLQTHIGIPRVAVI